MGIQCLLFPAADGYFSCFSIGFLTSFPPLKAYFPLTPKSYVLYPVALGSGTASFGIESSAYFIGHGPAAAWTYGDILLVQYFDRLHLVIFPEPS